jgi:hypothetical protein
MPSPFVCGICGQEFGTLSERAEHIRKEHLED